MKDLISNCFLCEEKALHVAGTEDAQVMQCINCGYTTSTKFSGTKETNEEFQKLGEDMKNWAKEENGYIWIPSIMTLPLGMLYPINEEVVEGVGDKDSDIELGKKSNMRSIYIVNKNYKYTSSFDPDFKVMNLYEAYEIIKSETC